MISNTFRLTHIIASADLMTIMTMFSIPFTSKGLPFHSFYRLLLNLGKICPLTVLNFRENATVSPEGAPDLPRS